MNANYYYPTIKVATESSRCILYNATKRKNTGTVSVSFQYIHTMFHAIYF